MMYKEYGLDESTFMGAWYMPEDICDDILDTFKKNKHMWSKGAVLEKAEDEGVGQSDTKIKDSFDIGILAKENWYPFNKYKEHLNNIFKLYNEKYEPTQGLEEFGIIENYNIQYYPPGGGFKKWHSERTNAVSVNREFVFMTYLNDVPAGGTEFAYQKLTTPAEKGLTLIWPAAWTHTHKGALVLKEKYIVTGWVGYIEPKLVDFYMNNYGRGRSGE